MWAWAPLSFAQRRNPKRTKRAHKATSGKRKTQKQANKPRRSQKIGQQKKTRKTEAETHKNITLKNK
jgi:hypothetical protein